MTRAEREENFKNRPAGGYDLYGGGVFNGQKGTMTISGATTIANNSAGEFGGVHNAQNTMTVLTPGTMVHVLGPRGRQ